MSTLPSVELAVLGPLQVKQDGTPVTIPGAKPRAILTMLALHNSSVVSADTLIELLWGEDPPRTAAKALQTHISALRRALGDGVVATEGAGWTLKGCNVDASRYKAAAKLARDAAASGDSSQAAARFEEALTLWRGIPELPDGRRGLSEKTRWIEGHAALVEDRADALLATGRAAEVIGDLEAAVADAPLRERRWGQLMLALYRAGRQGEALGAYQRARSLLADELGVDPGPELRRLETAVVAQDPSLDAPVTQHLSTVMRAVTFLLTDIEGSTAAWEADAAAMAWALARHDELVEQVVTSRGGRLIKTRGEGDATFSVFERPSAAAAAAIELQDAIGSEPWSLAQPMRIRVALHTGEVELRDGDYFGRAVNRAARLRSLAAGGQILCSGAVAELVIDSLPDDVLLNDLGMRQLKNLPRPEHVFELRFDNAAAEVEPAATETPMERPALPAVLIGPGPFVGRGRELERLLSTWRTALADGAHAVLIAGEPGVGKTRLAGEWSQQAYEQGAVVLYGRCDEDLGAAYQPFAEALRSLIPCIGASRLRGLRGVETLLSLVPGLTDVLPDLAAAARTDLDTERFALFDAVVALLELASAEAPIVLILDDLHWAAKPTLLLLRHVLRFGDHARVQIVGTYRSTDLDRSHPLAAMLADLHRDGTADRLNLSGLDEDDVTAYVAEAGYDDEELASALASVTGGNPFFLIEALRHVDESGGVWDQSTLPQGVREAVSRRLSRLPAETNKALAAAAVVGSRFAVDLVEQVVGSDLIDAFDEAAKAGIVIEEPGGHYRFNHALVRQSLLAELASVRRMRLHQRIAATLETQPGADDELLAELAYHYFECAWAGNAVKAVEYCRRAADQAMARLAYEGAADFFDRALHALEEIDDELPDRDEQTAELLIARCEALLAAGDVGSATGAVSQLRDATLNSPRLAAWAACFDGELSILIHPERLDEAEAAVDAAADKLAEFDDAAGEAKAHTVHATCLARLGRIADCEVALDDALTAARRARDHRRVNAVLANAPLAALWGPNPVPRAGGRCLDVVRLLRITTDSPAVEATSTRCQAVLEAFRGRGAAARRMIDSARRAVTELGLRHALLEVEQFAGIVELVVDEPAAAEPYLRKAYNGFRRMGLDADTAETAALLGRACLTLGRETEADELCTESERLAGHALKASIAWRTLRARLLSLAGDHDEARRVAEAAVALAERTDALVDHGDACLTLATVLGAAGNVAGARATAERAINLYERKGAAALAERARLVLGTESPPVVPAEAPSIELTNACVEAANQLIAAVHREAWDEVVQLLAPYVTIDNRRKIVGFPRKVIPSSEWPDGMRRFLRSGQVRYRPEAIAVRGERLAVFRLKVSTADTSAGAPQDEMVQLLGLDEAGRIALEVSFDVEDLDVALAELDNVNAQFEQQHPRPLENGCVRAINEVVTALNSEAWSQAAQLFPADARVESRRKIVGFNQGDLSSRGLVATIRDLSRETGATRFQHRIVAIRGESLALVHLEVGTADASSEAPQDEMLQLVGLGESGRIALEVWFDVEDMDAALAELDAVHAEWEQEQSRARRHENAASRVDERLTASFTARDWDAAAEALAPDMLYDDRRHVANAGLRRGRDAEMVNVRALADLGANVTSTVVATRGEHLVLTHARFTGADRGPEAFHNVMLSLLEIDSDERVTSRVVFDLDDIDAAFEELDARYLAGEADAHAHAWTAVMGCYAALNRREMPPTTNNFESIDHRRAVSFARGDIKTYTRAAWNQIPNIRFRIETVHQLSDLGAVVTQSLRGTSQEGFEAEWREIHLMTLEGDLFNRSEMFDEADLAAAIARFDQLSRPAPRLENAASRLYERFKVSYAARDWSWVSALLADNVRSEDRRHPINSGIRQGPDALIAEISALAEVGIDLTTEVVATRGERLVLSRIYTSGRDQGPDGFGSVDLDILELGPDGRFVARIVFNLDDVDAAFDELDARYLAGEAAVYAHAWAAVLKPYTAINRQELFVTTPDWVNIDHRQGAAFAPGDANEYVRASLEDGAGSIYVETVHRLTDLGAVVTWAATGTTREGFGAEWRGIHLLTIDGDQLSRFEVFDEADLHAALTKFDQLNRPRPQLENTASQVTDRFLAYYVAGEWQAMAEVLADNYCSDDRRPLVGSGVRHGRDAHLADLRARAELWLTNRTSTVIATRGERLALMSIGLSNREQGDEAFVTRLLIVNEIGADERLTAGVAFNLDDFDAAVAELDARYLAGEAAPYAQTWSVITEGYAGFNSRELAATTPDWVNIDHRRAAAFAPGELIAYIQAAWDDSPDTKIHIAAVHRLSNIGAVVTHVAHGISQDGFDAEWRDVFLLTVEGDLINHEELFDETDLDAAIARFEELSRQTPRRLENAASQAIERYAAHFATRDWDGLGKVLADNVITDDRRRGANAGIRHGRDAEIANLRVGADLGATSMTSAVVASRGERLILTRVSGRDDRFEDFVNEMLGVVEINSNDEIAAIVVFGVDDFEVAIAELDARYLTGEAAPYANTWSAVTAAFAAINRHELPELAPQWVNLDHRRGARFAPGDMTAFVKDIFKDEPDLNVFIEAVHQISNHGVVVAQKAHGTSQEGFEAEWREIGIFLFKGGLLSRCELFDEADLDAALARFDELSRPPRGLKNMATRTYERVQACFVARDWNAITAMLTDDISTDDRRGVVNAGIRRGRDAAIQDLRANAEIAVSDIASTVIAIRGEHLVLNRIRSRGRDKRPDAFHAEVLDVVEINSDGAVFARVVFDVNDFKAAIAELDARYLAGEAADCAHTWSVITACYAAINRHEQPPMTPDWANVDHRREVAMGPSDAMAYISAGLDSDQAFTSYVASVHRLNGGGAVITYGAQETSQDGFDAEWRGVAVHLVDGEMVNRSELYDEPDLDLALARFDQLSRSTPQLENSASQAAKRFYASYGAGDWDAMAAILAAGIVVDDRRRMVNAGRWHGRDVAIANHRAIAEAGADITPTVVATRGGRLALIRGRSRDLQHHEFDVEFLTIVEVDTDEKILAHIAFEADDIDTAFEELEARYAAGEAAAHERTWSLIARTYAGFNRGEIPAATREWTNIDHRHGSSMAPGEGEAYFRASWELAADLSVYIEAVHRLSERGAVFTHVGRGISRDGFEAEWRTVDIMTVNGELINRVELYDEADLDAALAMFDQLSQPALRLENTATRVWERLYSDIAAGDWNAVTELTAENVSVDDRRRVVNAGILHGRDANIKDAQATVDVGFTMTMVDTRATRGERLALIRVRVSGDDPQTIQNDALCMLEIDGDERIAAVITFDLDDFDSALAEIDARYLAREAATHASVWSAVVGAYAAAGQQELKLTPDCVSIDHRRTRAFAPGELRAYMNATWALAPDVIPYLEAVHRLDDVGAVVTHAVRGSSREGFDAEWREVSVLTFDGDLVNHCELFDEEDIDAALAKFDELNRPVPRLENAASQVAERFLWFFAEENWDAIAKTLSDQYVSDDRRQVVSGGVRHGRDAEIADLRAIADVWNRNLTSTVLATRGNRLVLTRVWVSDPEQGDEAFLTETLCVIEIDDDERLIAVVSFDIDAIDAAFEELESRYLAGEAAIHSHTWSVITGIYVAFNRHELPATDWTTVDHRRATPFASASITESVRAIWDLTPHLTIQIEAVHRLTKLGSVITHTQHGTSSEGFDAEWRQIQILTVDGDRIDRCEIFDEDDLDAALARFDELSYPARLGNTASRVAERYWKYFGAREWDAMTTSVTDDFVNDDRRRVVGAGSQLGMKAVIADMRVIAKIYLENVTTTVIATRGERLTLMRVGFSSRDQGSEAFVTEVLAVAEINADERLAVGISFDADDLDAALAELDARYLAGEAAPYATVWSTIMQGYAALNRHEFPPMTPDGVNVDHRRGRAFAPGDLPLYLDASWELMPEVSLYVDAVHQLSDVGAVVTHVVHGATREGFDAEWREINVLKSAGDRVSRCELFDEEDFDTALSTFAEWRPQARQLENAASRADDRVLAHVRRGNWAAIAPMLAEASSVQDRRRVVNIGVWDGRDAMIANFRALAEAVADLRWHVIAIRGERLALTRICAPSRDLQEGEFDVEMLGIAELDTDDKLATHVLFDAEDVDAALAELDARYLAGEAAAYADTWSAVARIHAAVNRRELPAMTPNHVYIDHRPLVSIEGVDARTSLGALWDLTSVFSVYAEAVHRLDELGVVITQVVKATTHEGLDTEMRMIAMAIVEGELCSRIEYFDEADLDVALARFEELHSEASRLENAATIVDQRFCAYFAARDWDAMAEVLSDDTVMADRRRVVNGGIRRGRDAEIASERAVADVGVTSYTPTVIAIRGKRLCLGCYSIADGWAGSKVLCISEVNAENQNTARVVFDSDDIDAAFAELDARYLAGEAAAYAHTWSVIAGIQAAVNRRELPPMTPNPGYIDHRPLVSVEDVDLAASIRAVFDIFSTYSVYVEAVHRLDERGAVYTQVHKGTSHHGVDVELRMIEVQIIEGDLLSHVEVFDEADLDTALARFDELSRSRRLENTASKVTERFWSSYAARDWDAMAELLTESVFTDDRRRVVNAGVQHGRDNQIANLRDLAEVHADIALSVIATRGQRLVLTRICSSNHDLEHGEFDVELLAVAEIDAESRIAVTVSFDPDDLDAAFAELDARYLAGEAAAHSHTWSLMTNNYAALNRHEIPPTTADLVNLDHRRGRAFETGDIFKYVRVTRDMLPDFKIYVETVHRLTESGAVVTQVLKGSTREGFNAEWREITLFTFESGLSNRFEIFDEEDLDAALARFDGLNQTTPVLHNASTRTWAQLVAAYNRRDMSGFLALMSEDARLDDRRKGLRGIHDGLALWKNVQQLFQAPINWQLSMEPIAIRGSRLSLTRHYIRDFDDVDQPITWETLCVMEVGEDGLMRDQTTFDPDDIDAAFQELDARYLAGEAAAHARTWSVITRSYSASNWHELPGMTPDSVFIDHRSLLTTDPENLAGYLPSIWELMPDVSSCIEAVHRLSDQGAVITHAARGTSQEGFDAEWRVIAVGIVVGDLYSRVEVFDEADLDAALARFDELDQSSPKMS